MLGNCYSNFVRPSSAVVSTNTVPSLTGEEAKRIYLEEISDVGNPIRCISDNQSENKPHCKNLYIKHQFSKNNLFKCVQKNDCKTLIHILNTCPSLISVTDDYGWSLLMIACQADSVDTVIELLRRGIDISVRDKAGNSACSLVIKNRNLALADILLAHQSNKPAPQNTAEIVRKPKSQRKDMYLCEICNREFPDKEEHLSSTVHNISASKGKKIPTNYEIPASNKGYQLMLRVGWDKDSGLGRDGSGKKYPLKTVQKLDRKGFGLNKTKGNQEERKETVKHVNRRMLDQEHRNSKSMEINFRRQFY